MKHKNNFFKLSSILLGVFLFLFCCLVANPYEVESNSNKALLRTAEVEQLSYGEQVELLVAQFNEYETTNSEYSIHFSGTIEQSISDFYGINNLADCDNENKELEKRVSTTYNYLTNEFTVSIDVYQDDILLESWCENATPLYDAERDEGYIEIDGERIYLAECLQIDGIDNCFVGVDDAAVASLAAAALLITIIVTPPSVHQEIIKTVTQVVETVVEAVKSFWSWLTRWVTKIFTRTVTTTTTVTTHTPTLRISNITYETKEVTLADLKNEKKYPRSQYYICFVDKKIYVSTLPISEAEAVKVLMDGDVVKNEDTGREMIASTFTQKESDALKIAKAAKLNDRTPEWDPEFDHGAYHYHSSVTKMVNGKLHSPHSFLLIRGV